MPDAGDDIVFDDAPELIKEQSEKDQLMGRRRRNLVQNNNGGFLRGPNPGQDIYSADYQRSGSRKDEVIAKS